MSSGRYTKVVTGYEDIFLTGEPRTSYFLTRYSKKLYNYQTYIIETDILDKVNYGTLLRTIIPEKGDIIKGIIIKVIVPTEYISMYGGYALIDYCDLIIGGHLIDRLTGEYMSLLLDKKCSIVQQQNIGLFGTTITNRALLSTDGMTQLFFEIPFYFFNKLHLGIPICALYKHKVEFHVKIKEWTLLKETKHYSDSSNKYISRFFDNKNDSVVPMKVFSTLVEYVKLPDEIREKIKNSTMTYTITQTQLQHELIPKYADYFDTSLKFINPVHNLLFYYKTRQNIDHKLYGGSGSRLDDLRWWYVSPSTIPSTYYKKIKELVYKYGNAMCKTIIGLEIPPDTFSQVLGYSNFLSLEYSSLHHMIDMKLSFNGENIIDPDNSGHFLMMNQVHKLMKKGTVNVPMMYSLIGPARDYSPCYYFHNFTENFVSENPGGQVNFSRIRDKDLHINLVPSIYDRILHIYAQSNNVLKVKDGMAGLMFTSAIEYNSTEFIPKSWYYNSVNFYSPTGDPNDASTFFIGNSSKKLNTPYSFLFYYNPVWFYNGTSYVSYNVSTYPQFFKYRDFPDLLVENSVVPNIAKPY
jgi:hypothetical protein